MLKMISNWFSLLFVALVIWRVSEILMQNIDSPEEHIWFKVGEVELP